MRFAKLPVTVFLACLLGAGTVQGLVIRHDTPTIDYENYGKWERFNASCVIMRANDTDYGIAGATAVDSRWGVAARHTLRHVETWLDDGNSAVYRGRNWIGASYQGFANIGVEEVTHFDDDFTRFANAIDIAVVKTLAPSSTLRIAPLYSSWDEVGRVGSGASGANNRQDGDGVSRKTENQNTSNSSRYWEVRWAGKNNIDQVNTQAFGSPNNALLKVDLDHPTDTTQSNMGGNTAIDLEYGSMGGDSGSPIYADKNGVAGQLVGVLSGGTGNVYGTTVVYVRIRPYKTWITDTLLANPDSRTLSLAAIPDQLIEVGETLTVTAVASGSESPPLSRSYRLLNPPDDATIDPDTGELTWTPIATQGGATHPVTIEVVEDGAVANTASTSFDVTVSGSGVAEFWNWSGAPPGWSKVTVGDGGSPYGEDSASFPYLQGDANCLIHQQITGTIPAWANVAVAIKLADFHQAWSSGGILEYGLRDAEPTVANAANAFLYSGTATVPNYDGVALVDGLGNTGGNVDYFFNFQSSTAIVDPWFMVRKNEDGNRFAVDDIVISYYFDDADGDGLPDQQEDALGTDPNLADSDGDGLDDGAEVASGTSPLDPDSDADGYADGYETNTLASNPLDADDPGGPDPLAIGINFVASSGQDAGIGLPVNAYAGAPGVAHQNWNQTNPVTGNSGNTSNIASPVAGTLVDSRGDATGATLSFTMNNPWSSDNEDFTPFGKLMSGYLDTNASNDCHVTLSAIPYTLYDVYVYFGSDVNGRTGAITDGTTTYSLTTASKSSTAGSYLKTEDTGSSNPSANYAVFADKTGSNLTVTYLRGGGNGGIHGVQIVPRSVPSAYESWAFGYGLDPSTDGDPNFDADHDGDPNLLEFALLSSPVDPSSRPVLTISNEGSSFSLTYVKAKAADSLAISVQGSDDLIGWSTMGITESQPSEDAVSRTMKASIATGGLPSYFLRVRVTSP